MGIHKSGFRCMYEGAPHDLSYMRVLFFLVVEPSKIIFFI